MRPPRFSPWLVAATLIAAGTLAAVGYGLTAPREYDATASLLVAPVSANDPTFAGLDLLRDVNGKRTAAASAAALVKTPEVADAVERQLGLERSRDSLLDRVRTRVVGGSNVVEVTAKDTSAEGAARLANAVVDALIARRTATFQSQLASVVSRNQQLLSAGSAAERADVARRLATLRTFVGQADPTLRRSSTARAPSSAAWPGWLGLILTGAGAGIAAGALAALAIVLLRGGPRYDRPVRPRASDDGAAEALVDRLEQRLAGRESALAARERDLRQRIDELRAIEAGSPDAAAFAERERQLAERERQLEERVAAVTKRELAVARAAAAAHSDGRPVPARTNASFNLGVLERLVSEHASAHPDRLEEWQSYLFFLRDYAGTDGHLPHSFDALVEETFRPLLTVS